MFQQAVQNNIRLVPEISSQSFILQPGLNLCAGQFFDDFLNSQSFLQYPESPFQSSKTPLQTNQHLNGHQIDYFEPEGQTDQKIRKLSLDVNRCKKKKNRKPSIFLKLLCLIVVFVSIICFGVFIQIHDNFKEVQTYQPKIQVQTVSQPKIPTKTNSFTLQQNHHKKSQNLHIKNPEFTQSKNPSQIISKSVNKRKPVSINDLKNKKQKTANELKFNTDLSAKQGKQIQISNLKKKDKNLNFNKEQPSQCQKYIVKQLQMFGYMYQFKNSHQQFTKISNVGLLTPPLLTHLTKEQYSEAIQLLQLIHHGFQDGTIRVTDTPCEKAQSLKNRLNHTMQKQFTRLNQKYQIDSYHSKQLRFCIVSNSYRNAQRGLIYRNIDSILQQNYTNYHVVYTDDASPDLTGQKVLEYLKTRNVSEEKFKVKTNNVKLGMMENIYNAITNNCQSGEIAVMLDGDDSFIGVNVLSLLNAVYQKEKVALVWNNFLQIFQNRRATIGFSMDIDQANKNKRHFRDPSRFVSSHLKSFYVDLFRQIKVNDLKHENGSFYGGASDTAMMACMIEMVYPYYRYVPEIVYEYRYDTGQLGMSVNRQPQLKAIAKMRVTRPYKTLENLSFIEGGLSNLLQINK